MKSIIAICDREEEYAQRLMEYMNRKNSFFLQAQAFSREESIRKYADKNKINFLLISESMLNEKTAFVQAGKTVILSEQRDSLKSSDEAKIYKYQSAENIVSEVMSLYEAEGIVSGDFKIRKGEKKIIGIYSPASAGEKTEFSLAFAKVLSKYTEVLYMNLESFSGLEELLEGNDKGDLSDLLYFARQAKLSPAARLPAVTVSNGSLDVVVPARFPEDIKEIEIKQWSELFSALLSDTDYKLLLINIGNEVRDALGLCTLCSLVIVPERESVIESARIKELEEYIEQRGLDGAAFRRYRLPEIKGTACGKNYIEELAWNELGDFIKNLIQRENIID